MLALLLLWVIWRMAGQDLGSYVCLVWMGMHWVAWAVWVAGEMDRVRVWYAEQAILHEARKAASCQRHMT